MMRLGKTSLPGVGVSEHGRTYRDAMRVLQEMDCETWTDAVEEVYRRRVHVLPDGTYVTAPYSLGRISGSVPYMETENLTLGQLKAAIDAVLSENPDAVTAQLDIRLCTYGTVPRGCDAESGKRLYPVSVEFSDFKLVKDHVRVRLYVPKAFDNEGGNFAGEERWSELNVPDSDNREEYRA